MVSEPNDEQLVDLADGILSGPEWDTWLAAHPNEAAEVMIARRVRQITAELRSASIAVPPDFEARLMARLNQDTTLLGLLDLGLFGLSRTMLELLAIIFDFIPQPQPAVAA